MRTLIAVHNATVPSKVAVVNVTWAVIYCSEDHVDSNLLTVAHDVTQVRR